MIFRDRFKDKVIILTGAARGIGRATALRAAREGRVMVLADRLKEQGEETLQLIKDAGGKGSFFLWTFPWRKTQSARAKSGRSIRSY